MQQKQRMKATKIQEVTIRWKIFVSKLWMSQKPIWLLGNHLITFPRYMFVGKFIVTNFFLPMKRNLMRLLLKNKQLHAGLCNRKSFHCIFT